GLAVILPPARCEPFGRIVIERVAFFEDGFARANEIAQHAVNEGSKRGCFRLKARRADGEIDGGVVWNVQKKNLRGCRDQRHLGGSGRGRRTPFIYFCKSGRGGPETPEGSGGDGARRRGVAGRKPQNPRERRPRRKAFVKRMPSGNDIAQNCRSRDPR